MYNNSAEDLLLYACPDCKGPLHLASVALCCTHCKEAFPIWEGIPDFLLEELSESDSPLARWSERYYDRQARFYEWPRWPLVLAIYGGWGSPSFNKLLKEMISMIPIQQGVFLDVACGPGTLGRRFASESRTVYGIDVSWGVLEQGVRYVNRQRIPNVHFARAQVEKLPFREKLFDGAFCGSALHLFLEPVRALQEIGCTLKPGAALVGLTIIAGERGILKYKSMREHAYRDGYHVFTPLQVDESLSQAGFADISYKLYGSLILFHARRDG